MYMRKSRRKNPPLLVLGNPALTRAARKFIGRKIKKLRHEGYPSKQAAAVAYSMARRKGFKVPKANPAPAPPGIPSWMWNDPEFQAELRAFRRRHGPRKPVEIIPVKVPKGFPRFMSVYGEAAHAVYDAPPGSPKGKRIHPFGRRGKGRPWLVSSVARGPKFLAYVGGSFKALPDWIHD
jgi:hypothetical protein